MERTIKEVTLVALYESYEGYLHGAADVNEPGDPYDPSFWPMYYGNWDLVALTNVPEDVAEKLLVQGTSDQWYGDGYDAANAALPYVSTTVYHHDGAR